MQEKLNYNSFDKIFLITKKTEYDVIEKYKNTAENILILFIGLQKPKKFYEKQYKKINFLSFEWNDYFIEQPLNRWSLNQKLIGYTDKIWPSILKNNSIIFSILNKIYKSKEVFIGAKKKIIIDLKYYLEIEHIFEYIYKKNNNIKVYVDKKFLKKITYYLSNDQIKKNTNFSSNLIITNKRNFQFLKKNLLTIFYPFYAITTIRKIFFKKKNVKIAISTYNKGLSLEEEKHNLNWILDKKNFNANNSIFVYEDKPNPSLIKSIRNNKYQSFFATSTNPLHECSIKFLISLILIYMPINLFLCIVLIFQKDYFKIEILNCLIRFLIWKNFTDCVNCESYISLPGYSSNYIYRNILLKKNDCITLSFKHTHSNTVYDNIEKDNYADGEFLFLNYDIEFHWSNSSLQQSKINNKSEAKKYVISGPIWSSKNFTEPFLKKVNVEKNSIVFFPSSINSYYSVNGISSHLKFINFMKSVIKKYKDINIIYKPKKPIENYYKNKILKECLEDLKTNTRFKISDNSVPSNKFFNYSNLCISMPFSSIVLEGIATGNKCFFLDLNNSYPNSLYSGFENLVSSNENSALENINYWLNIDNVSLQKKYKDILNKLEIPYNGNDAANIIINKTQEFINEK